MKNLLKLLLVSGTVAMAAASAQAADSLDALLEEVKKNRVSEARVNKQREAEFQAARADKQALLNKARAGLKAEKERGDRLKKQFEENEVTLANKEVELQNAVGTLGEMFGVVRQASAEAYGRISTSIVSAQYPGRADFLERMSNESKGLPNIKELEDLWFALQTEMTQSGKVSRFTTEVVSLDGGSEQKEVVRIGTFNLVSAEGYLTYKDDLKQVQPLGRQPDGYMVNSATGFATGGSGLEAVYIDPSQGQILGLLTAKATMMERYHAGGLPGYVITVMLAIGLLIALYKIIVLTVMSGGIRKQLNNPQNPSTSNPLGRILTVYEENKNADTETLELKLDEAILRELPSIESGINLIKILAAIAPLLGLLGTVIGMIATFQQITLFGTGDPRIMAGSISMALVTTAQGIIAALPLILLHSVVAGRSKSIVHILDEQAAGIVAARAEGEKA
ncbi:MotA/TolQ/ExbB proton channel family protein [Paraneptunicella aestuarii]|uniref:MotA/TolQ/ExbB proton channel family protein n=1 Tax=Paraneptunicella aestuarii TaxID=2831148 RepID=UPI001E3CD4FD|nr:MotA/TolQ/ExbB proton channel family protein [Paraneptunicella aestuarii]UAA37771.1 MotA/TolQ/ExbB proton channel family protein [Paraneptunicella aestuarii]